MGISKSGTAHLFESRVPRLETLNRICAVERLRVAWLSQGEGAPYVVEAAADGRMLQDAIESGAHMWLVLHDGQRLVICAGTEVRKTWPRREGTEPLVLRYREWRVLDCTGDVRTTVAPLYAVLLEQPATEIRVQAMAPERLEAVRQGAVGNWELFGDFAGDNTTSVWAKAFSVTAPDVLQITIGSLYQALPPTDREGFSYDRPGRVIGLRAAEGEPDLNALWERIPRERRHLALRMLLVFADP